MPGQTPTTDGTVTTQEVLAALTDMLVEIIGEDLLLDVDVALDTSFDADLQLESIEFVALAEKLTERYGAAVDFVAWLSGMELDDIIDLSVGDVVAFVVSAA